VFACTGQAAQKECVMKNTIKLFGIIAMVAVIGFSMAACGGDDDNGGGGSPTPFSNTTWNDEMEMMTISFDGSNGVAWKMGTTDIVRGTYTVSGNDINFTLNYVSEAGAAFGAKVGDKGKLTVSTDGNTLTDDEGESYTKKK
jgi:hypothetical protein